MEQLEQDLAKALVAQDEARSKVRAAAQQPDQMSQAPSVEGAQMQDAWEALVMHQEQEPAPDDEVLRQIPWHPSGRVPPLPPCDQAQP